MKKYWLAFLALIVILLFAVVIFDPFGITSPDKCAQNGNENNGICPSGIINKEPMVPLPVDNGKGQFGELIVVDQPQPNDVVEDIIFIKGQARGNWYFEASFPVKLIDSNNKVIAESFAQAQGEWMTEEFVPFTSEINFTRAETDSGFLILENDNPSGLPENHKEVRVPVIFKNSNQDTVKVFFGRSGSDPGVDVCNTVYPLVRPIAETKAVARAALEALLAGPTAEEKAQGYFSSINPGVKINKLTITDGIAKVDFDKRLEEAVGGSCRVLAIRTEIVSTLKQFSTVKDVVISVEGRVEDILQP